MTCPRSIVTWFALAGLFAAAGACAQQWSGDGEGFVSTSPSPLADGLELSRRYFSPVVHDRLLRFTAREGIDLRGQDIDLGRERFDLFVPSAEPAAGYGLLVFISPMPRHEMPRDWKRELDRRGLVLVAARDAGNRADPLKRRIPLALHAYEFARQGRRIDPARVYVGGFSGGSRVAQRVASSYADVFRGALLVAGSEPMLEDGYVPPPGEVMALFQARSRVVFATGQKDGRNRARDGRTRESLAPFCVAGVQAVAMPGLDHWLPEGRNLARALDALETPVVPGPADDACRAALAAEVAAALDAAEARLQAQGPAAALPLVRDIDDRYGGLASPRIEPLARAVDAAEPADGR